MLPPTGRLDPALVRRAAMRAASDARYRAVEIGRCQAIADQLRAELDLHPKQRAYAFDDASQVAALCTRQAGKTRGNVECLLDTALTKPNSYSVYIRTSKDEIRQNIWDTRDDVGLLATIQRLGIPCATPRDSRMEIAIPATGARIKLIGIDDREAVRKLRGPIYDLAIIDEAQDIGFLAAILRAIRAGLVKRHGQLRLTGTPGEVADGEFFEITRQDGHRMPGWSVHEFTIYDNPGIPDAEAYVEAKKRENGWTDDNEEYLREFRGRWVTAHRLLVYRLASVPQDERYYTDLPSGDYDWRYVVGVDLGFYPDPFAVVVWAYCDDLPKLYEVHSATYESLNTEQQAGLLANLVEQYNPERMVCDAGSGGLKQIVIGDWQQRYGLPVDVAQKAEKDSAIDSFNADLVAGRVLLREGSPLDKQMLILPWKDQVGARRVEDVHRNKGRFHNDLCDAALYSYRETPFFDARPRQTRPTYGTPEYEEHVIDVHKDQLLRRYDEEHTEAMTIGDLEPGEWRKWNR